jgi:hypothetical protein
VRRIAEFEVAVDNRVVVGKELVEADIVVVSIVEVVEVGNIVDSGTP